MFVTHCLLKQSVPGKANYLEKYNYFVKKKILQRFFYKNRNIIVRKDSARQYPDNLQKMHIKFTIRFGFAA
jgi:hypothetical protein